MPEKEPNSEATIFVNECAEIAVYLEPLGCASWGDPYASASECPDGTVRNRTIGTTNHRKIVGESRSSPGA